MLTNSKRHINDYYWCIVYTDSNGMKTEAGNKASRLGILQWIIENQDQLPSDLIGVVTLKRAGM